MTKKKRLFLIDGYSNIFRAFYAIRNLSNSKGEPTNAVYGFLQMLRKLLRDESPDLVGVAFDVSGETVRSEKFEEYKANRAPMPEDLRPQIPWIRRIIEAHRIPVIELEKYEADDVLGTLARKAAAAGYQVILVSADKDLMQLVTDDVSLMHTGRSKLYDPALVEEDFGVPPEKVIDVLALKGDAVDNVPGVPGIGDKGAKQLIREFGSVEELLERADEVPRKSYREGLQQNRDLALLSKDLVTIHVDLPLDFDEERFAHEPPDKEMLLDLVRELEFNTLRRELEGELGTETLDPAKEAESAAGWIGAVRDVPSRVFVGLVGEPIPVGLSVVSGGGHVVLADFRRPGLREAALGSLREWLADAEREVAGHDLKEVLRLVPEVVPKAGLVDTMLISYVLVPALRSHSLEFVAMERLGIQTTTAKEAGFAKGATPAPGTEALLTLAAERAELPRRLVPAMEEDLEDGMVRVYKELEAPLIPVLVRMEEAGVLLDSSFLERMSQEMEQEIAGLERGIYELAGERFNINSPKQLGVLMFEKLGYPVLKKTRKTKSYSTSAEILQQLASMGHELPERLLRFRELTKLKSTYVDALPGMVADDGRVHTRFQQAVAATGRLSSVNPNLQNIPIRTKRGQQIRRAFRAPEGSVLLVADYNQVELRVLAHIADDKVLIAGFEAGEDIHISTAAAVFGGAPELINPEQRRAAKAINFGIVYGISAFGLARNLGIPQPEARRFIDTYLDRYAGVKVYMEETLEAAESAGRVETLFGRVRWLPDIHSKNHNLRENAKRMAINARIQGTAADLLKKAMIAVDGRLRDECPEVLLLLTVHDELVLEVPNGEVSRVTDLVREEMEGAASLSVPLTVDVGTGETWYDAKT